MKGTMVSTLYKILGARIKKVRQDKSMSQDDLSEKINISRTSIVNIEQGRQKPPLHVIYKLADVLDIEPHDLLPTLTELKDQPSSSKLDATTLDMVDKKTEGNTEARRKLLEVIKQIEKEI